MNFLLDGTPPISVVWLLDYGMWSSHIMVQNVCALQTNFFFLFSEVKDFCQNEKLVANCGNDKVIVMETALYGRMELRKDG